jgi:hypothetical protein
MDLEKDIPNTFHKYSKNTSKQVKGKKKGRRYENCKNNFIFLKFIHFI